jgi:D-glycero-D-manno-heptose 1,7-bisphosphate phosphatase
MPRRFVMLDRDGTLIHERHYLADPDGVELLPGVPEALSTFRELGLGLVVVTNQSGIGRGFFDAPRLDEIHARMNALLAARGVALDGIYVCPHLPADGCACRKPATALITRAAADLDFDPADGFVIGDTAIDMQLGKRVGAATILVLTGYGERDREQAGPAADHVASDLLAAVPIVCRALRPPAAG